MTLSLDTIKNFLVSRNLVQSGSSIEDPKPELGFKLSHNEHTKQLKVKVIGARHLPTSYGSIRPEGYLVKVKVYPGSEKLETQMVKESWPTFNQEFTFDLLQMSSAKSTDQFVGKFVVLTIYAILESQDLCEKSKSKNSVMKIVSTITSREGIRRDDKTRRSKRISLSNRRTVGAVTYNLEPKLFTQKLRNNCLTTPDIWREVQTISSGREVESRESKKGELEITFSYSNSEDGNNDLLEVSLSRLRCSINTMQEHEKYGGSLYIKMTAQCDGELLAKWKSDRFQPTISMKIEPKTAIMHAFIKKNQLNNITITIRLMNKNALAKKTLLGKIELNMKSDLWQKVIQNPSIPVTEMMRFS
ncbi:uncharacterized protein LOC108732533 [Agrilus planipennis]|uniref:Uncharacterized protein LOC108732533 n=1 Tax=Agrilus planipennis TaxID=224129 RepID=A0A1W4W437_AGRPL|nr:uncharacterized protein LOC108732533 [Agrilus planipennis]XP_018318904.1 uncharacterized protein LOC108732533 [Agrilus planipennis]XP_018318905.1 uncharacterized protein LOC108732533 [Agrilus planipennis]